jgi:hypothetical protein
VHAAVHQKAKLLRPGQVHHEAKQPEGGGVVVLVKELGRGFAEPDEEGRVDPLDELARSCL